MIDPSPFKAAPQRLQVVPRTTRGALLSGLMGVFRFVAAATIAATEGFRVIARSPRAVLVWGLMWVVWFSVTAGVVATGEKVVVSTRIARWTVWEVVRHYGPFATVLIALFFLVFGMTAIASFRAVLNPEQKRFFFLRLGRDELRVASISVMAFSLVAIFGGMPAGALIALASPIMAAAPALAKQIGVLGAVVTVCLEIWLCVRLSLIAVETFAEHRFHLSAYWPLARGRFWYLMLCYCVIFLILFVIMIVYFTTNELLFGLALNIAGHTGMFQRVVVLGIAGVMAVLAAGYLLLTIVLFCTCQARAYLTITSAMPNVRQSPWGAATPDAAPSPSAGF